MKIIISYLALIENNDNCLSKTGENSKLLHKRRYTTNLTRLTATTKCITYIRKNLKVKNATIFSSKVLIVLQISLKWEKTAR